MKKAYYLSSALLFLFAGFGVYVAKRRSTAFLPPSIPRPKSDAPLPSNLSDLKRFIEANRGSRNEKTQDRVGAARLRLAYAAASKKDWQGARTTLLQTAIEYEGSNSASGEFGGVPDQARYQAAICLIAQGKKDSGRSELVSFMRNEPLSPLVTAAYRRIQRLDGKPDDRLLELLQRDVALQEKRARFEASVCGPLCIQRLLNAREIPLSKQSRGISDYHLIAKLCGTTDKGTTVRQMCAGLGKLGYPAYAYLLNAKDLRRAPTPAILLARDHYLLIESTAGDHATVFDPAIRSTTSWTLPQDERFEAAVICFQPLELSR